MKKTLIILTLLAGSYWAQATAVAPLPPFYPESKPAGTYDPNKFTPKNAAAIDLPSGRTCERNFVETISLNGTWKFSGLERGTTPFRADADLNKGYERPGFDDSRWDSLPVPYNFYLKYKYVPKTPYVKGWYRKTITIPAAAKGKRVILHFAVTGYEALLFVNGKKAGSHHGDFTPWEADITDFVAPGKPAVIALRVFSDLGPKKSCDASTIITTSKHPYGSQYAPSNIKGGIWRSAEMRLEPVVRIDRALVNPELKSSSILVSVEAVNSGSSVRRAELYGTVANAEAKSSAESPFQVGKLSTLTLKPGRNVFDVRIPLTNPKFWSPDSPNLYHLVLALQENGKPLSVKTERFGFRDFKTAGDHFLLNGKRIYLFGESIEVANSFEKGKPELDQPDTDPQARKAAAEVLLGFKSRGSNTLRLSEQPVAEVFLDLADEVGMMIYDMWAWSYNNKLDPSFEKTDFEEVTEWVRRDYNHPAVVMWLGGNEVRCDKAVAAIFDRQTRLIRSLDRSKRPVNAFSGIEFAGAIKLDTDMLDLHSYLGLAEPWPFWERNFNWHYTQAVTNYAKDGKTIGLPYVIWELVGFSWGQRSADFKPGDVDTYLKWAKAPTEWGRPNGIGWSGSIGLAAALDKKRGGRWGMEIIGKKIMEYVRQDTRVCGFAPWFCKNSITLPATSLWTQPVFCGLRGEAGIPLRNVFGGREYRQTAFVVNSTGTVYDDAEIRVSLREADGQEKLLTEWRPGKLPAWEKNTKELTFVIPPSPVARWAQIRVRVMDRNGKELSRNFYDVFVQDRSEVMAPVRTEITVGIPAVGATGTARLKEMLKTWKIKFADVTDPGDLAKYRVMIIPPSAGEPAGLGLGSSFLPAVLNWVRQGGTLLVLEQSWNGEFRLFSKTIRSVSAVFADLVVPAHPAFKGLSQPNFEFWNNPVRGQTATHVLTPLGADVIAARGPMLGFTEIFSILCDGKLGQGRIIASQFDACSLWDIDSAASTYLRNLVIAALSAPPSSIRPWEARSDDLTVSRHAKIVPLDLRARVNMGFKDDKSGDGKGGWTDQGDNDFRMMPLGRQVFKGIPFEIIDPSSNGGKSCLVVKGKPYGDLVASIKGIKAGQRFLRLFFLHGEAFSSSGDSLKYVIHYADGKSLDILTVNGLTIGDWWISGDLPGAKLGFSRIHRQGKEVGLFIMEWANPRPEVPIESVDVVAPAGKDSISMVTAISGEIADRAVLPLGGNKWNCLVDAGKDKILKEGPFLPSAVKEPSAGPDAVSVKMPERQANGPRPVIFTRFLAADQARKLTGPYRYLVMELKSDSNGDIQFFLPERNFKAKFLKNLSLSKDNVFHTVRIPLDDMTFKAEDLRGELYIYSSSSREKAQSGLSFRLRNLRLE